LNATGRSVNAALPIDFSLPAIQATNSEFAGTVRATLAPIADSFSVAVVT
jgi:hypothetical protein